jgi:hypothetical protein
LKWNKVYLMMWTNKIPKQDDFPYDWSKGVP